MLRRKLTQGVVFAGLAVGLATLLGTSSARADEPITISPAIHRSGGDVASGANIQLARHYYGGGGYGWGGGYRGGYYGGYGGGFYGGGVGIGLYAPVYRRYPGFGTPVYAAPVYAPPIYGYPAGGYPGYGYPGYGYGCW